jgi:hypothetical protein
MNSITRTSSSTTSLRRIRRTISCSGTCARHRGLCSPRPMLHGCRRSCMTMSETAKGEPSWRACASTIRAQNRVRDRRSAVLASYGSGDTCGITSWPATHREIGRGFGRPALNRAAAFLVDSLRIRAQNPACHAGVSRELVVVMCSRSCWPCEHVGRGAPLPIPLFAPAHAGSPQRTARRRHTCRVGRT